MNSKFTNFLLVAILIFLFAGILYGQNNLERLDAQSTFVLNPNPHKVNISGDAIPVEEIFGLNQNEFLSGPRSRGNLFTCTTARKVIEHRMYLNPTVATQMWFCIYEGAAQIGIYNLVHSVDVSPQGPGEGWYTSGPMEYDLIPGMFYLIHVSFEQVTSYWNENPVAPYPVPSTFGELTASAGFNYAPTSNFPPDATQDVPATAFGNPVAYYQTIVTDDILTAPTAPSNLVVTPVNGTSIEVTWTDNSGNEEGFLVQRKLTTGGTWADLTTVGADVTSYLDISLVTGNEYCYQVRAYNVGGNSAYSNEACATTNPNVPNAPTLESPDDGALEVETSLLLTWTASVGADSYGLQVSLTSTFSSTIYDETEITTTSYPLSNLAENTKYYWRVNATNTGGTSGYSSPFNFTTVSTITLNSNIAFPSKTNPSDYTSNEYRIVGLPGASNLPVSSILTGNQGTDWEVYWDNGSASDFFVKFNSSNPFRFSTGRSYWIIRKGNLNINETVQAAPLNTSGTVNITLENQNGFNLITNPFTLDVDWDAVQAANGGFAEEISTFNNGWSSSQTLEPYIGYLFDNPGLNTLQIPYPVGSSPLEKKTDPTIWRVNVELTCGELFDKTTSFGISSEATAGRDKLDFRKPRGMGNIPFVYFYHPDWDDGYGIFETDIRPEFEEEQTWDLKVYSELRESEKLTFSGIDEIPIELAIFLIDKDRAKYLNLREESEYEFTPVKNVSDFQILVGKMEKISSKLNNLIPSEFALGNNFPNPFNPVTTIPLSVPQLAEIRLVIYNILGQEVKMLFNGTVEAGKHWYVWDGKDEKGFTVPSGIYVYNFISDAGINISRKMILMK
ncbi:MAG: fibronectin type III domain-containing protein [Bacteroidetes bacterium]|nr:fibronectin type III domain-containing protein [Bacteroidota bacterium]